MLYLGLLILIILSGTLGAYMQTKKQRAEVAAAKLQAAKIKQAGEIQGQQKAQQILAKNTKQTANYQQNITDELDSFALDNQTRQDRIDQREKALVAARSHLDETAERLNADRDKLNEVKQQIETTKVSADELLTKRTDTLETQAQLKVTEAQHQILSELDQQLQHEQQANLRFQREDDESNVTKMSKLLATDAIQRGPVDFPREHTEHTVSIPEADVRQKLLDHDEQMLRYLEAVTGTDLIFDPNAETELEIVTGDPLRREEARVALTNLVVGHQWNTLAIEKAIDDARQTVINELHHTGESVAVKLHIGWMHPDLMKLVGRLKFRTSYGQNVLNHSIEVAQIAGVLAAELGIDEQLARRAGLLHDIGKAIDRNIEGTHVELGVQLTELYDEDPAIINAIAAHHGDTESTSPIAALVEAGDSVSGGRQGARSESAEEYINRLRSLEQIANKQPGVKESYAIQAGREIRIIVDPRKIDDQANQSLTEEVRDEIESELTYPGKIKVTTVRDFRTTAYVGAEKKTKQKKRA
ncbi:ribonuclease Y [Lentilactobacillus senioris]|uniref:ribonuclease Y n=1 Tax=Lentilactobacillus senioris TaxID=931534 RepID=UPI0022816403|nr:ribonuclease Y [Lentilactobacillus senioris]MCY9806296.1 ribonuclease Y [Lentilactobacillus senioris]